jgi:small-conductance mechanosensitive channel
MENLPPSLQTALTNFLLFLPDLVVALVVFIATIILAGFLRKVVQRTLEARGATVQVSRLLGNFIRWGVLVIGLITALEQVNFDVTAFVAGLGVLGLAAGFALQDLMSNFVSGILLLIQQPFKPGDLVEVGGYLGNVVVVDLRSTHIQTLDGQDVLVPNSKVLGNAITNLAQSPHKRVDVAAGVAAGNDLDKVRAAALKAVQGVPALVTDPAPLVRFHTLGIGVIGLDVHFWVDSTHIHPLDAKDAGVTLIKRTFEEEGIESPMPTTRVLLEK